MRYHSYLNSAKAIIESYKGDVPFAVFLKKYFNAHKKYGGRDRKQIAALCYHFYRLGKAAPLLPPEEKIIVGVFLCENTSNDFLQFHKPEWNAIIDRPITEKLQAACITGEDIFPWAEALSDGIDAELFRHSFLIQPDLFLRIRPGKKDIVIQKLKEAGTPFDLVTDTCIALPNSTKIDTILNIDQEVVIQDRNSQRVLDGIKEAVSYELRATSNEMQASGHELRASSYGPGETTNPKLQTPNPKQPGPGKDLTVWDCCAASGGKSILAYDMLAGKIDITVSDIRESILANLRKRFEVAGITKYNSFVADLAGQSSILHQQYSIVICDAPCTGSGTWSRTPEQLYYLKRKTIDVYVKMQQQIVSNVIPHLQPGGILVYITCSVFTNENEDMVNFIKEKFHLQLLQMELLQGYDKKADSMFAAVFIK